MATLLREAGFTVALPARPAPPVAAGRGA
jgi:hypothetical protein